jgi:hypothetical protein
VLSRLEEAYRYSCTYCDGLQWPVSDGQVCDAVIAGFGAGEYVYNGSNCAYMSADYTHLIGIQGVSATQERWGIAGSPSYTDGEATLMRSDNITTVGNSSAQVFEWVFHWWVYAGGKLRDPSAGTSRSGTWGAYEDELFKDYRRWDAGGSTHYWHGSNPSGQSTETGAIWKMQYSNPGIASPEFSGPPTP